MKRLLMAAGPAALVALASWSSLARADEPVPSAAPQSGADWMRSMHEAYYAAGSDMKARVLLRLVPPNGKARERRLTMVRADLEGAGEQRYFMHFTEPADVRNTAFLVWRHDEANDDRWVFVPALNLVRRIAADDSRSSFVGSDFTHEDVSGRNPALDEHAFDGREEIDGRTCVRIRSVPRGRDPGAAGGTAVITWIDEATRLPLRQDFLDARGEAVRRLTVDEVSEVRAPDGTAIPTALRRTMADLATGHKSEVVFEEVQYDLGVDPAAMNEAALRRPPREWTR